MNKKILVAILGLPVVAHQLHDHHRPIEGFAEIFVSPNFRAPPSVFLLHGQEPEEPGGPLRTAQTIAVSSSTATSTISGSMGFATLPFDIKDFIITDVSSGSTHRST